MTINAVDRARQTIQPLVDAGELSLSASEASMLVAAMAIAIEGAENRGARFEREACAKVAETCRHDDPSMHATSFVRGVIAAAIRARGREGRDG